MDISTSNTIRVAEAADILGVTKRHIVRLIDKGYFVSVYKYDGIRGPYLLNRAEVEAKANQNG